MDEYLNFVYQVTKKFPKEELYVTVSQWRRSTLSVILNYVEGYARRRPLVQLNFLDQSYGSFKELKYLLFFVHKQIFIAQQDYNYDLNLAEEIGKMLWTEVKSLEENTKQVK